MRKAITSFFLLGLSGCAASLTEIRNNPIVAEFDTALTPRAVRDCLVITLANSDWRPIETGDDQLRELTFSTAMYGAMLHFTIHALDGGAHVVTRRASAIPAGLSKASDCYPVK